MHILDITNQQSVVGTITRSSRNRYAMRGVPVIEEAARVAIPAHL